MSEVASKVSHSWRPPRLRLFESGHRKATWLELLYDLVFVVAVAELAGSLAEHPDGRHLLIYCGLFVPVWWAWAGYVFYANRFDTDDVSHRLLAGCQMLAVAGMAAAVGDIEGRAPLFAVCYVIVRALLVLAYVRVRRHVPDARPLVDRYIAGFCVAIVIWLGSLAVDGTARYVLWGVAMAVDLVTPLLTRRYQGVLPPQSEHLPERFGLFVVIVIGEVVASLVLGLKSHVLTASTLVVAAAGMAATVAIWWLYFDRLDEKVVLRTRFAGQVWVYSHLPLAMAVAAYGVGVEHVLAHPASRAHENFLLAAAAVVFVVLGVQLACSRDNRAALVRFVAGAAVAVAVGVGALVSGVPALAVVMVVAVLGGVQVWLLLAAPSDVDTEAHDANT